MPDKMQITILADGTIRVETDKISGPNHINAAQFLSEMSRLAGGQITIKAKHGKLAQPLAQNNQVRQ